MAGLQGGDRLEGHSIEIIMTNPELDSHITISQLPSEVLLLIFRRYSMTEWRGGDVPWIKVTHVCRRWREVALSASTLWSYIRITPSTSAKRVSTWIQRSQQAPLTVTSLPVSFFEMEVTEIHRIIMEHLTRIRELALYVLDIELFHPNSLAGPHHSLQNLTIDFVPHATAGYPGLPSISKLHTIFPSLSVLSLSHFHLDLDACQFPASLTSLRLFEGVPQSHVSLERMLDVLRGLPLLTSFALGSGKLSEITTATATSISSVSLPHLRYLNIAEQLHPCIGLLAHLIVPTGIQYSLRLLMTSESMPLLSTDAAVITSWMNRINRPSQQLHAQVG
ncbi:hypothetical protein BC835DRAFT_1307909 [Cytidiella melzeri]|nr:hypothetical protein BC835DRAFT_1307909 [Cytidiella melzeri]